jgi:hypothetical protein
MKHKTLTFGKKIAFATGMLVAVSAAMAGFALHTMDTSSEAFDVMAGKTTREIELAGAMSTAESNRTWRWGNAA